MSRSKTLYHIQQYDTKLDSSIKRIEEIDIIISDTEDLDKSIATQKAYKVEFDEKQKILRDSENSVEDQNLKIKQNEKRLYGGAITNPKELEDLQQESVSLQKYLAVLEERQLEAMIVSDQAQSQYNTASILVKDITQKLNSENELLLIEKKELQELISSLQKEKSNYLETNSTPDLSVYMKLRDSLGGIAVTLMINSSCSSCGANIPSAIEQEAKSPGNLSTCPACKRILHPGTK